MGGSRLGDRLADAGAAFATTARNRDLRRVQLAFGAANAAEFAFTVALGVVAFEAGGPAAVAAVGVVRLLPSALITPLAASLADRQRRERLLVASSVARAMFTGLAAAALALGAPLALTVAFAVLATISATPYRAAHSALLPSLCHTTQELTSSNVVRGMLDSLSIAIGPLGAAVLLGFFEPWAVFAAAAVSALWSAWLTTGLRYEPPPREMATGRPRPLAEAAEGLRAIRGDGRLAMMIGLGVVQTLLRGARDVFVVVLAIDLLGLGEPGVGTLTGVVGVGAVAGSLAAGLLIASRRMAGWFGAAVALWGLPFCVIGLLPEREVAFAMFAVVGVANAILDVSIYTVLGRLVPDAVLARVFGGMEALLALGVAAGALLAAPLIAWLDVSGALIVIGALGPVAVALALPRLWAIDRELGGRSDDVALLQRVPFLRPLPMPAVEQLARRLGRVDVGAGAQVFAAGDPGDAFYVIADGRVEVLDGARAVRAMAAGEGFGEIALLRRVPRTMTVRAAAPSTLLRIHRDDFLPAVTGFSGAAAEASSAAEGWLAASPGRAGA